MVPGAWQGLSSALMYSQGYHNQFKVAPNSGIRDYRYFQVGTEYLPRVWFSPELNAS
jgi:hypothetical protein